MMEFMKAKRLFFTWLFFFFLLTGSVQAAPVRFDASLRSLPFGKSIMFFEDAGKALTIDDVTQPDVQWTASEKQALNFGFTSSAYWFRFAVDNVLDHERQWYLELAFPHMDSIEMYMPQSNGTFRSTTTGSQYPFSDRDVPDKNFVFSISQPPGIATYYIRVTTVFPLMFNPIMHTQEGYRDRFNTTYPIFWLYYGILLIMVVYNLILYFFVRETDILCLVVFIAAFLLLQFSLDGFACQYLWPDATGWANVCMSMFMSWGTAAISLFVRQFIRFPEFFDDERVDKLWMYTVIAPNLVWPVVCLLIGIGRPVIFITSGLITYSTVLFVVVGGLCVWKDRTSRAVRFLWLSIGPLVIGAIVTILNSSGILPTTFWTAWAIHIGSVFFIALLSLGLADKLTSLKNNLVATNANTSLMLQSISQDASDDDRSIDNCREDEIGEILDGRFQQFMVHFKDLVDAVKRNTDLLNAAVAGLFGLSDRMADQTGRMSSRADSVASASEEMNARMLAISATMEQAAQNVNLIASSAEEMTATVQEITGNTEAARRTTAEAVSQSSKVTERVDKLGYAAEKIGSVTEAIAKISKKTNLLALNATIEAARAGMAGQGFGVVAGEIKALAGRTAEATKQISQQIEANREITAEAITEIRQIADIISRVDEIVATIAASIEEQSSSAQEVAGNVTQISQGVSETNQSVAQCSEVTGNVAREVWALSGTSQQMNDNSEHIRKSAAELSQMAEHLNNLMAKFRL